MVVELVILALSESPQTKLNLHVLQFAQARQILIKESDLLCEYLQCRAQNCPHVYPIVYE